MNFGAIIPSPYSIFLSACLYLFHSSPNFVDCILENDRYKDEVGLLQFFYSFAHHLSSQAE